MAAAVPVDAKHGSMNNDNVSIDMASRKSLLSKKLAQTGMFGKYLNRTCSITLLTLMGYTLFCGLNSEAHALQNLRKILKRYIFGTDYGQIMV